MLVRPLNKPPELAAGAEKGTTAGAYNAVFAFVRISDRGRVATGTRKFRMQIPAHRGQSFRRIADSIPVIADSF